MFNASWLYTGVVYAGAVWLARRRGIELPKRIAAFFYALVFVFFYPVLTQDAVNASPSLRLAPWADPVREGWRSLTPPLWNPFSGAGFPLLANPESSALSPLRILGLPLPLAQALAFEAAMKVLLALTFTYLWCRRRGSSDVAGAAGAVVFGFSTFVIGRLHSPLITTACLAPAVFYLLELLAERVTYRRVVALAITGAAMLFGGHPQTVLLATALATLYAFAKRGSKRMLLALLAGAVIAILIAAPLLVPFAEAWPKSTRSAAWDVQLPLVLLLAGLTAFAVDRIAAMPVVQMLVLVSIIAVLWIRAPLPDSIDPKTPMLRALDDLAKTEKQPFRIAGNAPHAHFAPFPDYDDPQVDYLNVRYVLTAAGGELPPRFHLRYDGPDGRIFENAEVLPRFFAVPNVVIEFRDDAFARLLKNHRDLRHTALLETLELESRQQHDDFFEPRPAGAPVAVAELVNAKPADYRLRVQAPRWSLVVSSIPWWPGWKVERNGARVEPIRVNGAFLGFAVPPGQLDVRVWYDPWTFRAGAIVSLATMAALVAYGVRRKPTT